MSDGSCVERICEYINDYHEKVRNSLYAICEFAVLMECNKNKVEPLNKEKSMKQKKEKER